jgi:hypothetical protein
LIPASLLNDFSAPPEKCAAQDFGYAFVFLSAPARWDADAGGAGTSTIC